MFSCQVPIGHTEAMAPLTQNLLHFPDWLVFRIKRGCPCLGAWCFVAVYKYVSRTYQHVCIHPKLQKGWTAAYYIDSDRTYKMKQTLLYGQTQSQKDNPILWVNLTSGNRSSLPLFPPTKQRQGMLPVIARRFQDKVFRSTFGELFLFILPRQWQLSL